MKVLLCSALLLSGLAFGKQQLKSSSDNQPRFIKCSVKCGAPSNSVSKPKHDATYCHKVKPIKGCFCGTMPQINDQIKQCSKQIKIQL